MCPPVPLSSGRSSLFSQTELLTFLNAGRNCPPAGAAVLEHLPGFLSSSTLQSSHPWAPTYQLPQKPEVLPCLVVTASVASPEHPRSLGSSRPAAPQLGSRAVSILHRGEPELSSTSCSSCSLGFVQETSLRWLWSLSWAQRFVQDWLKPPLTGSGPFRGHRGSAALS